MRYVYIAPSRTTSTFWPRGVENCRRGLRRVDHARVRGALPGGQMHISLEAVRFSGKYGPRPRRPSRRSEFASEAFLLTRNTPHGLARDSGIFYVFCGVLFPLSVLRLGTDGRAGIPLTYWFDSRAATHSDPCVETTLVGYSDLADPALLIVSSVASSASASWCSSRRILRAEGRQDRHDDVLLSAARLLRPADCRVGRVRALRRTKCSDYGRPFPTRMRAFTTEGGTRGTLCRRSAERGRHADVVAHPQFPGELDVSPRPLWWRWRASVSASRKSVVIRSMAILSPCLDVGVSPSIAHACSRIKTFLFYVVPSGGMTDETRPSASARSRAFVSTTQKRLPSGSARTTKSSPGPGDGRVWRQGKQSLDLPLGRPCRGRDAIGPVRAASRRWNVGPLAGRALFKITNGSPGVGGLTGRNEVPLARKPSFERSR